MMEMVLKPKRVSVVFLSIVLFLTLANAIALAFFFLVEDPRVIVLVQWFDLDIEGNIPSVYSALAIFVCAVLFFVIARYKATRLNYEALCWSGLAVIFLFLCADEALQIHETFGDVVENYITPTGFLYFPWVLPYGLALLIFTALYVKFVLQLPKYTAALFILSGTVYLTGAIGFDMLGGREAELHGVDSIAYCILYTIEEFLEMIGIVILIYALLSYIERQFGYIAITLQIRR